MKNHNNQGGIGVLVWGAVSLGAGLLLGRVLDLSSRDTVFLAVAIFIFSGLFSRWLDIKPEVRGEGEDGKADHAAASDSLPGLAMPAEFADDGERREWLDDFLVRHQDI